ncbi:hypothetical protein [Streptomyces sp. NRRL F-5755]|uniref:hypothetical protein n=1 Tax=Streptomyces sp. NRRL F-5755 TaxID=1519475 RepID=UPI001331A398|nr:hypothetical protein [Streptomyces sp. NRRL F-5755]
MRTRACHRRPCRPASAAAARWAAVAVVLLWSGPELAGLGLAVPGAPQTALFQLRDLVDLVVGEPVDLVGEQVREVGVEVREEAAHQNGAAVVAGAGAVEPAGHFRGPPRDGAGAPAVLCGRQHHQNGSYNQPSHFG